MLKYGFPALWEFVLGHLGTDLAVVVLMHRSGVLNVAVQKV